MCSADAWAQSSREKVASEVGAVKVARTTEGWRMDGRVVTSLGGLMDCWHLLTPGWLGTRLDFL